MSKNKNKSHTSIVILATALVLVTACLVLALVLLLSKSDDDQTVKKGAVVVTIDDTPLYENQIRYFATLLLEQESAAYQITGSNPAAAVNQTLVQNAVNFAKEYIFRLKEAKAAGIQLAEDQLAELEDTFDSEYETKKNVGTGTLEGDAFYNYYYGLTEKQFKQFWKDWALIEQYNQHCEANADVSETNQEKAYEEFEDYLAGCDATVLSLSLSTLSEAEIAAKKELADELAGKIRSGSDMLELIQKHCDDKDLVADQGKVRITNAVGSAFPELYTWTQDAGIRDVGVVKTDTAIYIIRCEGFTDYEALRNTTEMLEWTRLFAVNEATAALLQSSKYTVEIDKEVYASLDFLTLIQTVQAS